MYVSRIIKEQQQNTHPTSSSTQQQRDTINCPSLRTPLQKRSAQMVSWCGRPDENPPKAIKVGLFYIDGQCSATCHLVTNKRRQLLPRPTHTIIRRGKEIIITKRMANFIPPFFPFNERTVGGGGATVPPSIEKRLNPLVDTSSSSLVIGSVLSLECAPMGGNGLN